MHALRFAGGTDSDPRTYNRPSSAEVSCVVVGEGTLPEHFISVYERHSPEHMSESGLHKLSYVSEHVDPLTYPLIHVDGALGYSCALLTLPDPATGTSRKVGMAEFHARRIMQRLLGTSEEAELAHAAGDYTSST